MVFGRHCRVASLVILLSALSASAEVLPVTIVSSVGVSAKPIRALVVVSEKGHVVGVGPAEVVEEEGVSSVTAVGEVTLRLDGGPYTALFMVFGERGEVFSSTRNIMDLRTEPAVLLDSGELKRRLGEQRGELKKWDLKLNEQRVRLNKAREESETLRKVDQMIDGGNDIQASRNEESGIEASLAVARMRQDALKGRATPPNFKKREAELVMHLNTLATELKELEHDSSLGGASREYQEKRDLIEATKYEHMDLLKDELTQLRRKREELDRGGPQR